MKEKDIQRLKEYLKSVRMENSLESLIINLENNKHVYYTSPELSESESKTYNLIYDILKKKNLTSSEINSLMKKIDDYAYCKCRIYYEYGFKSGVSFCEE